MNIEVTRQQIRMQAEEWLAEYQNELASLYRTYDAVKAAKVEVSASDMRPTTKQISDLEKRCLRLQDILGEIKEAEDLDGEPTTFQGYVGKLAADNAYREAESYRAELGRIAAEKELRRLQGVHIYLDGEADFPILTCETLERYDELAAKADQNNYRDDDANF